MRYRVYFASLLVSLLVLLLVVCVNSIVDPLDVYRFVRKDGFNSIKSEYIPYARLAKPSQIERGQYDRLGIGSSRMLMGIPVDNAAWAKFGRGFDAGIQGADLVQIHDLFEHAVAVSHVKSVLIDLDIFMFNAWLPSGTYPYPVATLGETRYARFMRKRDTAMLLLFSPGVTLASVDTLRKQDKKRDKVMIDGTANPDKERRQVMHDGYEVRFRQFEDRMVRSAWSPCRDNRFAFTVGDINKMLVFRDILQIARDHNIDIKFFIPPIHVRMLEVMQAAGLDPYSDEMKRKLLDEIYAVYGNDQRYVALWDFSGYHRYAQEPVPQQSGIAMQWYLDSSHFSQALGQKLVNVMYGAPKAEKDFGVQLHKNNIEAFIQSWHIQQKAFQNANHDMSRQLHERAEAVLRDKENNGTTCGKAE